MLSWRNEEMFFRLRLYRLMETCSPSWARSRKPKLKVTKFHLRTGAASPPAPFSHKLEQYFPRTTFPHPPPTWLDGWNVSQPAKSFDIWLKRPLLTESPQHAY